MIITKLYSKELLKNVIRRMFARLKSGLRKTTLEFEKQSSILSLLCRWKVSRTASERFRNFGKLSLRVCSQ